MGLQEFGTGCGLVSRNWSIHRTRFGVAQEWHFGVDERVGTFWVLVAVVIQGPEEQGGADLGRITSTLGETTGRLLQFRFELGVLIDPRGTG